VRLRLARNRQAVVILLQSFKGITKGLERGLDPRVEGRDRLF
jgi:hypothetical protein